MGVHFTVSVAVASMIKPITAVVEWREPASGVPGRCRVVKQGRVVLGEAWFEVTARPGGLDPRHVWETVAAQR